MAEVMMEDYLDTMDEILDKAQTFPLSAKKSLVDVDQLRDCIDHIRMNIPSEVKQAKKIVQERKSIIDDANKQADEIVTRAENRAGALVANHEITKAAEARALEIEKQAVMKAKAVKDAADGYITDVLSKTEETLAASLTAVRRTKGTIKAPRNSAPAVNPNIPIQQIPPQQ